MTRIAGAKDVGRVTIDFEVANYGDVIQAMQGTLDPDKVRRVTLKGIVDSWATRFVLPEKVVKQLGLPLRGKVKVRYADGRRATRSAAQGAQVTIMGREDTFGAVVEPGRSTALIGAIILEDLDLLIDCTHNRLVPRDPRYIITEIE